MNSLDTSQTLNCQECREDIPAPEPKVIIGAQLFGIQRFFFFHPTCWQASRLNADPTAKRLFALLGKH